ncbi:MAG TPA: UDP-N-acetylmuramoyl-L-alanyl-D-glutamate--2,6-diaminopimelate ligase [Candidatus Gracilibacteria bacterium]
MLGFLRTIIPERSPARLGYHKFMAMIAAVVFRFPSNGMKVIAVTGTSGKTTTAGIIYHLLQSSGRKCGLICTSHFQIGDKFMPNKSLRTTLRAWTAQSLLRKMVRERCEFVVLEVSSHAIDQNRIWGINIDTAVLTNISENEHLDYHGNFADYIHTKAGLFRQLNASKRKPNVAKMSILNRDDRHYDLFEEIPSDRKWSYSLGKSADFTVQDVSLNEHGIKFTLPLPNHVLKIETPMIGKHNLMNLLAGITTAATVGVEVEQIPEILKTFTGVPGRLEAVNEGQSFGCVVDFSYKPSALKAVLETLRNIVKGRIIIVWGGAGGRSPENRAESAKLINDMADHFVLTTDDPYEEDPRKIAEEIKQFITRKEGDRFFEIEDRYEAIRYACYIAEAGDLVLIAGRGHEVVQTIGKQKIRFDDREVAREILQFAKKQDLL